MKVVLSLASIVIITAISLWFYPQLLGSIGLGHYTKTITDLRSRLSSQQENQKCTTASGEIIYGVISEPDDCVEIENIDSNITVVESPNQNDKRNAKTYKDFLPDKGFRNLTDFNCDGRTHCSEMTSCEEARFFLDNCTNTKMDGDGDGIPCERQGCG